MKARTRKLKLLAATYMVPDPDNKRRMLATKHAVFTDVKDLMFFVGHQPEDDSHSLRIYLSRCTVQLSARRPKIVEKKLKGPRKPETWCNMCNKKVAFVAIEGLLYRATCRHSFKPDDWMSLTKRLKTGAKTKMEQRRYRIFLYDPWHKTLGQQVWSGKQHKDLLRQQKIVCAAAGLKRKDFEKKFIWKLQ